MALGRLGTYNFRCCRCSPTICAFFAAQTKQASTLRMGTCSKQLPDPKRKKRNHATTILCHTVDKSRRDTNPFRTHQAHKRTAIASFLLLPGVSYKKIYHIHARTQPYSPHAGKVGKPLSRTDRSGVFPSLSEYETDATTSAPPGDPQRSSVASKSTRLSSRVETSKTTVLRSLPMVAKPRPSPTRAPTTGALNSTVTIAAVVGHGMMLPPVSEKIPETAAEICGCGGCFDAGGNGGLDRI